MARTNLDRKAWGAHWDGSGTRFSLRAPAATGVDLCLFDSPGQARESQRVPLQRGEGGSWSVYLSDAEPGQIYGYRVDGPYDPSRGHRFNAAKLLVDPYARALTGGNTWNDALLGYRPHAPRRDLSRSNADSAAWAARCVVVDPAFDWGDDAPPRTAWRDTVIYEAHVKGLTRLHPAVPRELRGTYTGLAHPAVVEHLIDLGVTAVELLPVFHSAAESHLAPTGRSNYWGYSPLAFFAPHAGYATGGPGDQVAEFKRMVRSLHEAGLEVILDVVYNHTVEGDQSGPTLSLRGIDNAGYYRLQPGRARFYEDFTGCGNTLDLRQPATLGLVIDSLRYWVEEMHVDGFRFDLGAMLGRDDSFFTPRSRFFAAVARESALAEVKLIAEPWDVGANGYQLGSFPRGWVEWNDRYRDGLRSFWRGDSGAGRELARRVAGSVDIFPPRLRGSAASVNMITCHDGFTLEDLVSFERKHNWPNGEGNRDGHNHNLSRNWGVEGPTDRVEVRQLRERAKRNLIATLAFSRGIPMLAHGDEIGRTQKGNNNAYCIDSPVTWVDWQIDDRQRRQLEFFREVMRLRLDYPELTSPPGSGDEDYWLTPQGTPLGEDAGVWDRKPAFARLVRGRRGTLLMLLNPTAKERLFTLPSAGAPWLELLATHRPTASERAGASSLLPAYSLSLLASAELDTTPRMSAGTTAGS